MISKSIPGVQEFHLDDTVKDKLFIHLEQLEKEKDFLEQS
jgi:hypothetical protein